MRARFLGPQPAPPSPRRARWMVTCWLATAGVLATYAAMAAGVTPIPFHVANVVGSIVLGADNARRRLWPQVTLNAVFGAIGAAALAGAWL